MPKRKREGLIIDRMEKQKYIMREAKERVTRKDKKADGFANNKKQNTKNLGNDLWTTFFSIELKLAEKKSMLC
jgi:hypothetical protein